MAPHSQSVLHEEDSRKIHQICDRLSRDANAKLVFLVDKNGQLLAAAGDRSAEMDTTSLASLAAGNIAASGGLAKMIGEEEFSNLVHEGASDHLHISIVSRRMILVVVFDSRSTLGLVRLRVKRAHGDLEKVIDEMGKRGNQGNLFVEITDEDIDNIFNDG